MAIINVNSISGINSITAQGASGIEFFDSSGSSVQKVTGDGLTVGTGATISGGTNLIRFDTGVTTPVQVDSNGHVGIGTDNNTSAALDVHGDIRISRGSRGDGTGKIMFGSDSGDYLQLQDIGTGGNIFELVQDGSKKVVVRGTNGNVGVGIDNPTSKLHIDGNVRSNEGYTVYPPSDSNYAFATRNAANNQWTAFIEASGKATFAGNVVLSTPGSGIDFSATSNSSGTMTSELLDDYEEGSWTPRITGSGGATGQSYAIQTGYYTKIGNVATYHFDVALSALGTLLGAYVVISNLPFSGGHGGNTGGHAIITYATNITFGNGDGRNVILAYMNNSTCYLMTPSNTSAGGVSLSDYILPSDGHIGSNSRLIGSITHHGV